MLTNKDFELSPEQFQTYRDWQKELNRGKEKLPWDELFASAEDVEVVFTFSCIGRGVIARIPAMRVEVVIEDFLFWCDSFINKET